ncbi:MAG TPA: hypothetical protein VHU77_08100 [Candidatus Limnocylindria bacterium]|nr:hypothetical protein [Candidatus Limnocylindria bacterium]
MSDEQMTQEQQEAVDRLAGTDSPPSDSTSQDSRVSTADLASAGDRQQQETAQPQQTVGSTDERAKSEAPVGIQSRDTSAQASPAQAETADAERTPVMSADAAEEYRGRWQETQADFVDDPRSAVATADALVAEVMKRVAEEFANERNGLEKQWNEGGEASTEDLRVAFQRYRSFFSRLLNL